MRRLAFEPVEAGDGGTAIVGRGEKQEVGELDYLLSDSSGKYF